MGHEKTIDPHHLLRRVMLAQMLFTAGNSLTIGGFFNYFVYQFGPSATMLALLQIAPETSEAASFCGRWIAVRLQDRKWLWIGGLILGRGAAMLIPLALLFPKSENELALVYVLCCTVLWYLAQGVAYIHFMSWLSDLSPRTNWGHFFGRRQLASILIAMTVPILVGLLRKNYLYELSSDGQRWSYGIIFFIGGLISLASILPMWRVPHPRWIQRSSSAVSFWPTRSFDLHWLLISRWWLAFFQGLTQVVLFKFNVDVLHISLETHYALTAVMLIVQLVMTPVAGRLSDRGQDRNGLVVGTFIVGCGLLFYFWITPETWWLLIGTNLLWGAFGLVNVCGENLCLKLSPISDNAQQFSLYRQASGLIAGLAGLLGGIWLDSLSIANSPASASGMLIIIACSVVGRLTAPLWLWPIESSAPTVADPSAVSPPN